MHVRRLMVTREFLLMKILLALLYVALELYYHNFIAIQYSHMGFGWDLSLFKYALTKLAFLVLLAASRPVYVASRFLYTIYLLLLFFFYIPNAILFAYGDLPPGPYASNVIFLSVFLLAPYLRIRFPFRAAEPRHASLLVAAPALLLLLPIVAAFGSEINLRTLLLSEVYETREVFSGLISGPIAYLYHIEVKTIIPAALVFFLMRRNYVVAALLVLSLLYLYVISGNKLVYFTSVIVLFFYAVGRSHVAKLNNFFLVVLVFFAIFPLIDGLLLETPLLAGTFVNRFLFIPALLTQFYFDFFDGRPFFFAESTLFNRLVDSPYDMPVGFLITAEYWNEPEVYANNGIVSDGFMNLSYAGVFLFSAVFAALFSYFDSMKLHRGYYGLFFCYVYIILSAPLLSCFITGGILIFIVAGPTVLRHTNPQPA